MHVALCSPAWPLERHHNGIVTYVHWMKRELERQSHRVSVFTAGCDADGADERVHRIQRGFIGQTARRLAGRLFSVEKDIFDFGGVIAESILRVHRREPIDVIEMEESFGWSAAVERLTGIPVLVKLHGPAFLSLVEEELATAFGQARVEHEGRALAAAKTIASPCGITMTQTIDRYGLTPAIAEHVVNPLPFNPDTPRWSLPACERETLLFVGRFDTRKGGDLVIRAFASLLRKRPALKLVFVGPDNGLLQPDGTRIMFEAFRNATLPANLHGQVDFRGRLAQPEIAALRTRAMVTVLASRWENQGYTALEAMMQGCPVVSSDAGGCPEIIDHGRTGLLARTGDAVDLAAQLGAMLDDPSAAAAMGEAARSYVTQTHAAEAVAAQSLALYERVIALAGRIERPAARTE